MDRKEKDKEREDKKRPSRVEKGDDRYEIERGKEPHKKENFPDEEEDQTR